MQNSIKILKAFLSFVLLIFISNNVVSQANRHLFSEYKYNYIQYDSCFLEKFGQQKSWENFYSKLEKLNFSGEGQISILHLGASHIQAGVWSWELRKNFETMMPQMAGAPGLVFPFSLAKTNHPFYYNSKFEGKWEFQKITDKETSIDIGLSGITAFTSDSLASILVFFNPVANIENHKFDKISIFHNIEDSCWSLKILPEELVDTVIMDFEIGASVFYFKEKLDTLQLVISKKDSCESVFYFQGAYLENSEPGINYCGIGINGASTSSYQKANLFEKHLKAVNPDLVILSIGVNDASGKNFKQEVYVKNYQAIIDKILKINSHCAILLTTNNDFYYYRGGVNLHNPEIYAGMEQLATKYGGCVWNMFRVMGGLKSINLWRSDELASQDRIHFTRMGYTIIADILFGAILNDYANYLNQRQNNIY